MENIPLERAFIRNSGENNLSQVQRFFDQPALDSGATLQDNLNYGGFCSLYWILFRAHWVLVIFDYALRTFYYGVRLMNFYDLYLKLYHFSPQPGEMGQALVSQNTWAYISTVLASSSHAQWRLTLIRLRLVWKLVLTMSILLIPASISFLQIDRVVNSTYIRTITAMTFVLSGSAGLSAAMLITNRSALESSEVRRRWVNASQQPNDLFSVDFWACLAMPLSCVVWAVVLSLVTVLSIIWNKPQNEREAADSDPSGKHIGLAFTYSLTTLTVFIVIVHFYRLFKFIFDKDRF